MRQESFGKIYHYKKVSVLSKFAEIHYAPAMLGHSDRFGTITPACSICHDRDNGSKCINCGSCGRLVNENKKKIRKKVFWSKKVNGGPKQKFWSGQHINPKNYFLV